MISFQVSAIQKQDAFHTKHADAIEAYQAAKTHFDAAMNGRTTLPISDRQKEQKELAAKRYDLCDEYYALKAEIPNMEALRRSVETLLQEEPGRAQPKRTHGECYLQRV